ncbi:MAG: EscU/YscU/HrcU family type III secretion system export apparatus switch protein [Planctomycetota bacterium]
MALFKDDSGKTEKPTPQRLSQARNKGQTAQSKEFVMAGLLLVGIVALKLLGPWLGSSLQAIIAAGLRLPAGIVEGAETGPVLAHITEQILTIGAPAAALMGSAVLAALLFGYGQIGFKWSREAIGVKFERLNPAANMSKLFNASALARTALALLKLIALGTSLYFVLVAEWETYSRLQDYEDLSVSVAILLDIALNAFLTIAVFVLVLAMADIAWQRYSFTKNLMMTKQEVDDERKTSDGDPLIKNRLKQARVELLRHRMMEAIPEADVVITNPTHYAAALRYDRTAHAAPELIAKGTDEVALHMRELAAEHGIPVMEDPPLARALCRSVKLGEQIPERFFKAVAAVLSHVYRVKDNVA